MADIFEEIYHTYKKPVYNYLYRCTLNVHTAEELTQETFLRALKYFSGFRGEAGAKTWLFKIARNAYLDRQKKNPPLPEADITEHPIPDNNDAYASSNEKDFINKILHSLKDEERTILVLRDMNDLTYKEVAHIMSYSEGQVKIGLHRARKKFREAYQKETEERR